MAVSNPDSIANEDVMKQYFDFFIEVMKSNDMVAVKYICSMFDDIFVNVRQSDTRSQVMAQYLDEILNNCGAGIFRKDLGIDMSHKEYYGKLMVTLITSAMDPNKLQNSIETFIQGIEVAMSYPKNQAEEIQNHMFMSISIALNKAKQMEVKLNSETLNKIYLIGTDIMKNRRCIDQEAMFMCASAAVCRFTINLGIG